MAQQRDRSTPTVDEEFFAAVGEVFQRFPDAAARYGLASTPDFVQPSNSTKTVRVNALQRTEDSFVFRSFDEQPPPGASHCAIWGTDPETGEPRCDVWWLVS